MTVFKLHYDSGSGSPAPAPEELILRIKEAFPGALTSVEEALSAEARRVQASFEASGRADDEIARSIVRSLQNKAERMGPVYRFSMVMDASAKVHGHVRPGHITFFYEGIPSDDSERAILSFLSSLNLGSVETTEC